ncbi:MAG: carbohydrate binding family 9 domain-containing protein [Chitinophagaceae bacterium]|nr:carbohydrate binding family 9 domain-containing protein [Chitinophagaceae bacterium]
MIKLLPLILFIFYFLPVRAQAPNLDAVKTTQAIKIDGNLDESAWKDAKPATNFTITYPTFGKPSKRKTEVKILYDNTAVYVGAYMYDDPAEIRKQLTARDVLFLQDADVFTVEMDTYNDKQNGFLFSISAAGVQGDAKISGNNDFTWDAVWESKVSIKTDGWVAEMKIPFSAIRFPKTNVQDWGLQFVRFKRKTNENSTWSVEDPNISGNINQWGHWKGLQNISPPLRLSFLPYLSGGVRVSPAAKGNFTEYLKSGGMDVKYGINESFTLDMTLIPDFAQVQSDNTVLNLSPFEVKYDEHRPFFTEGTELFNKAGLFYPRRIGAQPGGLFDVLALARDSAQYKILKNPGITRLYNATKISGRTKHNLGIGVLNALAATMNARLENENTGEKINIETEPLTNYNIIVLDQAFKNRSSLTFTNTNVLRKGNSRNADVAGLDLGLFDKKNIYEFAFSGRYSAIWGKDGNKNGYRTDASYNKISGKFQYTLTTSVLSDSYDPNDLGFLYNNNGVTGVANVSYNIFTATKHFLNQRYRLRFSNAYLYNPFKWERLSISSSNYLLFKNFWDVTFEFFTQPFWSNDYFEPRTPGKFLKHPPIYFGTMHGSTDSRKKLYYEYNYSYGESPLPNDPYYKVENGLRYRFNDKFQVNADLNVSEDKGNWGYVYRDVNGLPIIGERNVRTDISTLGLNYNFDSKMNINVRVRHYWSQVHYTNFFDLKDDGYWTVKPFTPGYDQNFNTFNLDMFYTWDFLLGSRITLAWKNALGSNINIDGMLNNSYYKNFRQIFQNPHSNEVTLKIVYYLDYLSLKKNKK